MMKLPDSKTLMHTLAGASLTCALLVAAVYDVGHLHPEAQVQASVEPQVALSANALTAKAAILYDPATKEILFAKNADVQLPLASLTKLMTADTVLSLMATTSKITITQADLAPDGDWGLKPGERWNLLDILRFGLVASANDAMQAAADAAPGDVIADMNKRAQELGMTQSYFTNPTGLDVDTQTAGAYGSAHDVAVLAAAFLAQYPALFEATVHPSVSMTSGTVTLTATSTDIPILDIPGLIAAKTGYTDLAGGNLVAVFDVGLDHPLIAAVLGSTEDDRFTDIQTLVSAARRTYNQ